MPIVLDRQQIDAALPKVAPGLAKYLRIMEFVATDPAFHDNPEFRRAFNGFYRVRRSAQTWQPHFFALMARTRDQHFDFPRTLAELFGATGRVEASFTSKLYATIHPKAPVIDSVVLENLGLRLPSATDPKRLHKVAVIHESLTKTFADLLATEDGRHLVHSFRAAYPTAAVTDEKALDLVLWQIR
jgi:hypothetical protein